MRKYIERLTTIDQLIRKKATGSPKELALRLEISERTLFEYLEDMKRIGAPIAYSRSRRSYYYKTNGGISLKFIAV